MTAGERAAAAAIGCVGVPFRLHGRDPAGGLDCVGVAALAVQAAGGVLPVPTGYRLRFGDGAGAAALLDQWGARREVPAIGDILLMRPGAGQLHLAVWVGGGMVHADAGLRRVVLRPGSGGWPLVGAWGREG